MVEGLKLLSLHELVESHLDPLKMTEDLQEQILRSFLFICDDRAFIDDSSGETFYSIPYQEITECIYDHDFEISDELNSVIEGLIEPLKKMLKIDGLSTSELRKDENLNSTHQLNAYKRFVSHIELAVCQKKFISKETFKVSQKVQMLENQLKEANEDLKQSRVKIANSLRSVTNVDKIAKNALASAEKAQKDSEDSKTQFVTILGIFASIIVALFGGMSLVKAAVDLLSSKGALPLFVFVVSVLMLSFSALIVLLTSWITSLNKQESVGSYNLTKIIIFSFLLISCVGSGLISYDLSKRSKETDKQKSSTDLKLEINASN